MSSNMLKLNPDKTEFIIFGSSVQRQKLSSFFPIELMGRSLSPVDKVKNLGVIFYSNFTFSNHVAYICQTSYTSIRNFRRIRKFLTHSMAVTVANALVSCKLDYCNSLFRGLCKKDIHKLQCVQNSIARIVTKLLNLTILNPY